MALCLIDVLATIPDPRKLRGRRHPLTAILALAVLAILAGHSSLEAIAQFGRDHGPALAHALGFRRGKTPAKGTLSKLFRRLDIAAVEAALCRWLLERQHDGWQAIAIDGKTLRGTASGEAPGVHLLSAFVPAAAAVIAQLRVDAKTNEHKAALRLLGVLPCTGKVITGDAMFTHRDLADRPKPKRIEAYEAGARQQGRWVLARDLRAGDEVLLRQGEIVALESVCLDDLEERVYNFHVAELQNYAVGEFGVLVHNTNDSAGPGRTVIEEPAAARAADKMSGL